MAFSATKDKKYLDKFEYFLNTWIDQNGFMLGVNWSSPLEMGIRLVNWTLCWHAVKDDIDSELKARWTDSIYKQCWFINRNLSFCSSANNHLIGELAGLFVACTALPKFNKTRKWQRKAFRKLIRECEKQNYNDGVNKEQAIAYHHFDLDFLLIAGLVGKACQKDFPEKYWRRLEKMMEFLSAVEDFSGHVPQTGDEDDGLVLDVGQKEIGVYRSLLNTGAFIFNRKDFFKSQFNAADLKSQLLLNIAGINFIQMPTAEKPVPGSFPGGGYYILGTELNTEMEQKLIFDCGPLGYLSIAAHGHADALSFTLTAGGSRIFIDPGAYSYSAERLWRDYFRSSSAHNTLTVDGFNQSVITGDFMWSKKAVSTLIHFSDKNVKGSHDGYMRLSDKVEHTREIIYDDTGNIWKIIDELTCKEEHEVSLYLHCAPECSLEPRENRYNILFKKGVCELSFPPEAVVSLHRGEDTPLGWYSPSYDKKVPINTIKLTKNIKGNTKIVTEFKITFH
jgi:hypothetical protein